MLIGWITAMVVLLALCIAGAATGSVAMSYMAMGSIGTTLIVSFVLAMCEMAVTDKKR